MSGEENNGVNKHNVTYCSHYKQTFDICSSYFKIITDFSFYLVGDFASRPTYKKKRINERYQKSIQTSSLEIFKYKEPKLHENYIPEQRWEHITTRFSASAHQNEVECTSERGWVHIGARMSAHRSEDECTSERGSCQKQEDCMPEPGWLHWKSQILIITYNR